MIKFYFTKIMRAGFLILLLNTLYTMTYGMGNTLSCLRRTSHFMRDVCVFTPQHAHTLPQIYIRSFVHKKNDAGIDTKPCSTSIRIGNPCIDGVFQYGFAEPSILSDFINAALDLTGDQCIEEIHYLPKELPSSNPMSEFAYRFTVDVRCRAKDGRHFLVEMQNDFRADYHLKALIEHSRMMSRLDLEDTDEDQKHREANNKNDKKKFWKDIQGLYTIILTNKVFPLTKLKNNYKDEPVMEPFLVNPYEWRHTKVHTRHYGDVPNQIILLMLNNLKKEPGELKSNIERWAYVFKDHSLRTGGSKIAETREIENPALIAGNDQAIINFFNRVDMRHLPQDVRSQYISALKYYNTTIIDLEEQAETRGLEKGEAIGLERGKLEEKKEMALRMLKKNMPIADIIDLTGLSLKELEKVKQDILSD